MGAKEEAPSLHPLTTIAVLSHGKSHLPLGTEVLPSTDFSSTEPLGSCGRVIE